MKVTRFTPSRDLIIVPGRVQGPRGREQSLRFAVDTGAGQTVISPEFLDDLGYSAREHGEQLAVTRSAKQASAGRIGTRPINDVARRGKLAAVVDETYFATFLRAVECAGDRDGILGSDRLVFPPSPDFRYAATPLNAVTFADMGCDGVHYAILAIDGAITDDSPVIHVSPMDTGEPYTVLGTSFLDYLAVACDVPASELEGVFTRERFKGNTLVPFLRARFSSSRLYDDARFERLASHLAYIQPKPTGEG